MAVKIYGSCSGSAGKKYNLWLEVTQNGQSVKNNTSNLTVVLKLKRNDGYNDSAYNLNKNDNNAKITINNIEKTAQTLAIDTRNQATVTLCTWTGDVSHNADGTLTISIGGSFVMKGTSLAGGSVAGSFKCVTIPKASSFSVDVSSVNPEESVFLSLSPHSSAFNHKALFSIGEYSQELSVPAGVTKVEFIVPVEWANALPNSNTGVISITVTTLTGSSVIGKSSKTVKLFIPDTEKFLPTVLFSVKANKNGLVPQLWNAVLQHRSTIEAKLTGFEGAYGATLASCTFTLGNIVKVGTDVVFDLPIYGIIPVVATVKDSRGNVKKASFLQQIDEYSPPTLQCTGIFRCNENGTPSDSGACVSLSFEKTFSSVRDLNISKVKVKYKKSNETTFSDYVVLSTSPHVLKGGFLESASYDFVFEIEDMVTKTPFVIKRTLESASIPFNIKKGGKGAAFGCYAETENELTVAYDFNLKGGFKYESLNDSVTANENVRFVHKNIRKYPYFRIITVDVKLEFLSAGNANGVIDLFYIPNLNLAHTFPVHCHIDYRQPANKGETIAYVNVSGIGRVMNEKGFKTGETIILTGVVFY
jgi:hypothetical protein